MSIQNTGALINSDILQEFDCKKHNHKGKVPNAPNEYGRHVKKFHKRKP